MHLDLTHTSDGFGGCIIASATYSAYSRDGIVFDIRDRLTFTDVAGPVCRGDVPYVIADLLGISGGVVTYTIRHH